MLTKPCQGVDGFHGVLSFREQGVERWEIDSTIAFCAAAWPGAPGTWGHPSRAFALVCHPLSHAGYPIWGQVLDLALGLSPIHSSGCPDEPISGRKPG